MYLNTNFEDVKEGDTIYIPVRVVTGLMDGRDFYLPREVTRCTKTQFCTGGSSLKYRKENGRVVGDHYSARHLDRKIPGVDGFDPEKERAERDAFQFKITTLKDFTDVTIGKHWHRYHERFTPEMINAAHEFMKLWKESGNV